MKVRERHVTFKGHVPNGGVAPPDGRQPALGPSTERAAIAEASSPLPPIPGTSTETSDYVLKHGVVSSPIRLWRPAGGATGQEGEAAGRRGAAYARRVPSEPVLDSWAEGTICQSPQQLEKIRISASATHREATVSRRHTFQEGRSTVLLSGDCGMDGRPPGRRGRVRRTVSALMRPGSVLFPPEERPPKRTNNTPTTPPPPLPCPAPAPREPHASEAHVRTTQKLRSFRKKRLNVTPDSTTLAGAAIYNMDGGSRGLGALKSPQMIGQTELDYPGLSRANSATRTKSRIASAGDLSRIHRLASLNNHPHTETASSLTTPTRERSSVNRQESAIKTRPTTANPKIQDISDTEVRRSPVRWTPRPTSRDIRTSRSCNRDERVSQNGQMDGQYFPKDVNGKYGRTTFITSTKPTSSYRHLKSTIKLSSCHQQQQQQQPDGSPGQNGTTENGAAEHSATERDLEIVRWLEGCDQRPRKHVAFKLGEDTDGYLTEYFL